MRPPPPTIPGFPKDDPFELSLNQLIGGLSYLIWMVVRGVEEFPLRTIKAISEALDKISLESLLDEVSFLNTTLFLNNHKVQIPTGKMTPHEILDLSWFLLLRQLVRSQSTKLRLKNIFESKGIDKAFQVCRAIEQSLRMWMMAFVIFANRA